MVLAFWGLVLAVVIIALLGFCADLRTERAHAKEIQRRKALGYDR